MQASITFGSACRAERISRADFASPKLNAAVLLDPTIFAAALRSWDFARKDVDRSYNVNTTEATIRATAETAITMLCSFWRMDKSTYQRISSSLFYDLRQHQQF